MWNIRGAWIHADTKRWCTRSSPKLVIFNKCHIYESSTDFFLFFFIIIICGIKHVIGAIQTDTSFWHKQTSRGVKRRKKNQEDRKTEKEKKEKTHQLSIWRTTSFVGPLSFLSHLLRRTESPVALPPRDGCSTEVPGDTFLPLSLSLSTSSSVSAVF